MKINLVKGIFGMASVVRYVAEEANARFFIRVSLLAHYQAQ